MYHPDVPRQKYYHKEGKYNIYKKGGKVFVSNAPFGNEKPYQHEILPFNKFSPHISEFDFLNHHFTKVLSYETSPSSWTFVY